jgi:hypothetical protein
VANVGLPSQGEREKECMSASHQFLLVFAFIAPWNPWRIAVGFFTVAAAQPSALFENNAVIHLSVDINTIELNARAVIHAAVAYFVGAFAAGPVFSPADH